MNKSAGFAAFAIAAAAPFLPTFAAASASICDTVVGNLIQNCGFEAGTTTSTIGGSSDTLAPVDWTVNAAFDQFNGFNQVQGSTANSGNFSLKIGNDVGSPAPAISETLTTLKGATYAGTFYLAYGGSGGGNTAGAFFDAEVNGSIVKALDGTAPLAFTKETFSFVGTGSDTVTFTGNTNPSEWFIDDISVVTSAVPEPSLAWLMLIGAGALGFGMRRRSTDRQAPAAV